MIGFHFENKTALYVNAVNGSLQQNILIYFYELTEEQNYSLEDLQGLTRSFITSQFEVEIGNVYITHEEIKYCKGTMETWLNELIWEVWKRFLRVKENEVNDKEENLCLN